MDSKVGIKQDLSVSGDNTNITNTNDDHATTGGGTSTTAKAQAFHPLDSDPSVTVLTFKVPPAPIIGVEVTEDEDALASSKPIVVAPQKEAFFHICLDTSGSMAGSGINCAKEAMKELFQHLVENCRIPAERISVYLYSMTCTVRQMGQLDDFVWMDSIKAGGGM
ncbi:MAG: hypothetical protein J3R72DRAFT_158581 [Linnemannia gamsii]|nr:MAG: hypothetical protein J3R72DRAFT_158581 [Linnemannia gamsii]